MNKYILAIAIFTIFPAFTTSCEQTTEQKINTIKKELEAIEKENQWLKKEFETMWDFRPSNEKIIEMGIELNNTYTIDTNTREGKAAYIKYNILVKKQDEEWKKNGRSDKYKKITEEMNKTQKPFLDAKAERREQLMEEGRKIQKLDKYTRSITEKQHSLTIKKDSIIKAFLNTLTNTDKQTLEQKKYIIEREMELEIDEMIERHNNLFEEIQDLYSEKTPEGNRMMKLLNKEEREKMMERKEELMKKINDKANYKRIDSLKTVLNSIETERLEKATKDTKEEEKYIKEEIARLEKINPNFAKYNEEQKNRYVKVKIEIAKKKTDSLKAANYAK